MYQILDKYGDYFKIVRDRRARAADEAHAQRHTALVMGFACMEALINVFGSIGAIILFLVLSPIIAVQCVIATIKGGSE